MSKGPYAPRDPSPEEIREAVVLRNAWALGSGKPAEDEASIGAKALGPWLEVAAQSRRLHT